MDLENRRIVLQWYAAEYRQRVKAKWALRGVSKVGRKAIVLGRPRIDASGAPIDPANPPKPAPPDGGATDGESIFTSAGCGSCHTFAAAGSNGNVGPNLDESKPTLELAIDRITNGRGGMPSFEDQLSEEQIRAVAGYVAGE